MLAIFTGLAVKLSGGNLVPAPNAVIEVRRKDTGALAAIFSDEAGATPITNPSDFTDADGRFQFYAAGLLRGYEITGTDGVLIFTLHNVAIGTFAQLDNPFTTKGDLLFSLAGGVPTRKAIGSDAYSLLAEAGATEGALWLPPSARIERIINGQIVESHTGNAVTYTLKGKGGVDLSATNPCYLLFPSATLTSGDFDIVKLTANINVTVSSGSTLGHASAIAQHTFVYALKTGSTAELFVSNLPPDYPGTFLGQRLVTTTAEGGAGAADSATGVYSTTARSVVAWISVAKVKGTQTTAGTWAADPTQIDMAPFGIPQCAFSAHRNGTNQTGIVSGTSTKVQFTTEDYDFDGTFDNATNYRYQPNVAGLYEYFLLSRWTATIPDAIATGVLLQRNGITVLQAFNYASAINSDPSNGITINSVMNGTTDYAEGLVYQGAGSNKDLDGNAVATKFGGIRL